MGIKHALTSAVTDDGVAGEVGPSEWNANHLAPAMCVPFSISAVTWTNMPAAATIFNGATRARTKYDLTYATEVRLLSRVGTAGASGSALYVDWSTDESTWTELGAGSQRISLTTAGTIVTAWFAPAAGALADVYLQLMGVGGDAANDPAFGVTMLQVR